MTKAKIYNLAMTGLLKNREFEESKLKIKPDSELALARIAKVDNEIAELHEMILQAEREEAIMKTVTLYDESTGEYYTVQVENEDIAHEIECGCR